MTPLSDTGWFLSMPTSKMVGIAAGSFSVLAALYR